MMASSSSSLSPASSAVDSIDFAALLIALHETDEDVGTDVFTDVAPSPPSAFASASLETAVDRVQGGNP